jgi:hypothetical protein
MKNSVDNKKPPIINERIFETSDTSHMNAASYKNIGASLVIFVEMADSAIT